MPPPWAHEFVAQAANGLDAFAQVRFDLGFPHASALLMTAAK
jgi:hypothetical protein